MNYECKINNYKTFYSPAIHVIHLEDVSTDLSFKSESKKAKWKYREMIKSIEIFKNYIRTGGGQKYSIIFIENKTYNSFASTSLSNWRAA